MKLKQPLAKLSFLGFAAILFLAAGARASGPRTTVLYRFTGSPDGGSPNGQLISDQAGNLYGTTEFGGTSNSGVVFELSPPARKGNKWTETILYKFTGGSDGIGPNAGLVFDTAGNLYGTTFGGGDCPYSCGVVFRLAPSRTPGGVWTETVLHAFGGSNSPDGGNPTGSLVFDHAGNLYGTTELGGNVNCTIGPGPCGVVFQLSPPSLQTGPWTETVIYNFTGIPDGQFPYGFLTIDQRENLFGTTTEGGTGACTDGEGLTIGCGTVFKLSRSNGGSWTETVLYNFQTTDSGSSLDLLLDSTGALYGPAGNDVIKLAPPVKHGAPWTEHVLHQFKEGLKGRAPSSGVITDSRGNLYGTTWANGLESPYGTVYKLSPPATKGKKWALTTLHEFPGNFDSEQPKGLLLRSKSGDLYGATHAGFDDGYIFKIAP
jgi:uncharacterized repeat protein (TIGR03803 family)